MKKLVVFILILNLVLSISFVVLSRERPVEPVPPNFEFGTSLSFDSTSGRSSQAISTNVVFALDEDDFLEGLEGTNMNPTPTLTKSGGALHYRVCGWAFNAKITVKLNKDTPGSYQLKVSAETDQNSSTKILSTTEEYLVTGISGFFSCVEGDVNLTYELAFSNVPKLDEVGSNYKVTYTITKR